MTEPRTEAGRTFLAALQAMDALDDVAIATPVDWAHGILAIEAEASADGGQTGDEDVLAAALRDGAIPAMRWTARRLEALGEKRAEVDKLDADADKIEAILNGWSTRMTRPDWALRDSGAGGLDVAGLDRLVFKAEEYIEAVVTYLDPGNQFTHSRRRHLDRTGEELAELVAALRATPSPVPMDDCETPADIDCPFEHHVVHADPPVLRATPAADGAPE